MKALHYIEKKTLEWREIADAEIIKQTDAILKPLAVSACDLDRNIFTGRSPFPGPYVLGHEFTGEVIEIGDAVTSLKVGDVVLASFQPSCGCCIRCGLGHSSVCSEVPNTSMYGVGEAGGNWGGAIADTMRVPWADYNLLVIPDGVNPISLASASDNLADGLRAVDEALVQRPGASVLVAGLGGSIPLYTVLCASYLGSEQITFASQDSLGLEIAERLGADCIEVDDWPRKLGSFDITMDCTSHPDGLSSVIKSTSPHGWCTSASIYFAPTTPMPLSDMYMKGIQFRTGRVNSAAQLERVMDLIKNGLEPDKIEPVVYLPEEATHAFEIESISRKIIFDMRTRSSQLV